MKLGSAKKNPGKDIKKIQRQITEIQEEIIDLEDKLEDLTWDLGYYCKEIVKSINLLNNIKKVIKFSQINNIKIKINCTEDMEIMVFDYNEYGKIEKIKDFIW